MSDTKPDDIQLFVDLLDFIENGQDSRDYALTRALLKERIRERLERFVESRGWKHGGDCGGFWFHEPTWGTWKAAASWEGHSTNEPNGPNDHPRTYDNEFELYANEDLLEAANG
jgi:hypothetical protein